MLLQEEQTLLLTAVDMFTYTERKQKGLQRSFSLTAIAPI